MQQVWLPAVPLSMQVLRKWFTYVSTVLRRSWNQAHAVCLPRTCSKVMLQKWPVRPSKRQSTFRIGWSALHQPWGPIMSLNVNVLAAHGTRRPSFVFKYTGHLIKAVIEFDDSLQPGARCYRHAKKVHKLRIAAKFRAFLARAIGEMQVTHKT